MTHEPSRRPGPGWMPGRIFTGGGDAGWGPLKIRLWLLRRSTPSLTSGIAVAASFLVVETLVVCLLNVASGSTGRFGTLYLLGVLVVSAVWGFGLSALTSVVSAIAFAYFRNWPTGHFAPFDPQNGFVVVVFLAVALVANWLARLARTGERFIDLSSDLMCIAGPENVLRVNPAFTRILGYSLDELLSRPYTDLVVPEDQSRVRAVLEQLRGSANPGRFENRVYCSDGSQRWIEWSVVSDRGLFYAVGRDMTEHQREQEQLRQAEAAATASRDQLGELADQQAALRRVATLVARGVDSSELFKAVAKEMATCLGAELTAVWRYEPNRSAVPVATSEDPELLLPVGAYMTLEGENVLAMVLDSGRPARQNSIDIDNATGSAATLARAIGTRTAVGAPIFVDGRLWGMAGVGSTSPAPPPPDTEARLGDFADLVATAIANAATRDELIASRARIVAAADDARRRIERDLHDGAQQRLVSLGLQLRLAEDSVWPEQQSLKEQLAGVTSGLTAVSTELQQISRGIHPAILSKGGLGAALKTLARRCPVPVSLDVAVERRLPEPVEVAAYYVVAEALTDTAKYADASELIVSLEASGGTLIMSIQDDGIGGADTRKGSGLIGLKDRVEVLGGHLQIASQPGSGTSLHITIPLDGE